MLPCLCLKVEVGIVWFSESCCKDWLWQWHSQCGLCTSAVTNSKLFVTRLEVCTGNLRKLETQSHQLLLWHPHLGWWDPEHPRDQCDCCTCRGRGMGLSCTLAVNSVSVIRSQWTENVKLNKTDILLQTGEKHCFWTMLDVWLAFNQYYPLQHYSIY